MKLLLKLFVQHARRHPRVALRVVLLTMLVSSLWVLEPLYSARAIDMLLDIAEGKDVPIVKIFAVWGAIFLAISVAQSFHKFASWRFQNLIYADRCQEIYRHVLHLGIGFHVRQKSGEIIKRLDEGADYLHMMLERTMHEIAPGLLASVAFLILSILIEPRLAIILVVILSLYCCIVVYGTKRTSPKQHRVNKIWIKAMGHAYDVENNIFSVKSSAQEDAEVLRMKQWQGAALRRQYVLNRYWALIESMNFFMLTRILLIAIGVLFLVQGKLTLGELYFFQFSFFRVLVPFEMLAHLLPDWNRIMGKIRLSQEILEIEPDIPVLEGALMPKELKGNVTFDHVSFAYQKDIPSIEDEEDNDFDAKIDEMMAAEEEEALASSIKHAIVTTDKKEMTPEIDDKDQPNVIRGFHLDIRPGEHIAIVGPSGAGKSTIAALINRFYDTTSGRILFDGIDIREYDVRWLRSKIGLVLQENVMFNDTIINNIRYARPDATKEEVIDAATRAACHDFIKKLPHGYDTMIGERGIRLSGGERQRVAIARAILKQPSIVVLDEATSALDSKTERDVQRGIAQLLEGRTAFVIAHRLSTVQSMDRIAVVDKGTLIACAPHKELLQTCPLYGEMVKLQSHGMLAQ